MTYKLTNSVDGTARLNMHIDYRMSLEEMAVFITAEKTTDFAKGAAWDSTEPNKKTIKATLTSRQAAMKIAQTSLINYGAETPHYRVGDGNLNAVSEAVFQRLQTLWEG